MHSAMCRDAATPPLPPPPPDKHAAAANTSITLQHSVLNRRLCPMIDDKSQEQVFYRLSIAFCVPGRVGVDSHTFHSGEWSSDKPAAAVVRSLSRRGEY